MRFLRNLLSTRREDAWDRLCSATGALYVPADFFGAERVRIPMEPWTLTLDHPRVSRCEGTVVYTRIRAPYVTTADFWLLICHQRLSGEISRHVRMTHLDAPGLLGPEFIVKTNAPALAAGFLANDSITRRIAAQPQIYLHLKDDEGWLGKNFPTTADELHFRSPEVITDVERLMELVGLFGAVLGHLCDLGVASRRDPGVLL